MAKGTNNIAFTAPINPAGATKILTKSQVWAGLLLKIRSAETFTAKAIESTTVLSESVDAEGNPVTEREIVFRADHRKAKDTVTVYEDSRVDFVQSDGSKIFNVLSEGAEGELFLTYVFEWRHPGVGAEELKAFKDKEIKMGNAVKETVDVMRELVVKGEL
ncbi:uncharacterized protein PAC_20104 [Phialocephala subalpina]|uniref:Uncharacterized protein n=1 Tax=Phialocephala subalpina TaxID=576137 RepID=A0A1L7XYQ7_9HELO|nr:uncharacterized protein PAC_20104 [Phialocephala subalpina]